LGTWWKVWRPKKLTTHNRSEDGSDFRHLPYPDGHFDAIAYDPPYVAKGGRETSGIKSMDRRYGQEDCPATPALLQRLIEDGLTEMHRLVKPKGIVLVKCKNYVSSGKLWLGVHRTTEHAFWLGFSVEDMFQHIGEPGPQPPGRRQVHARQNYSTLLVLRKGKR
jgi:tRNA G10  N-methylase Trm11